MHLIDLSNYRPPEELRLKRDKSHAMRVEAANASQEYRRMQFNTDSLDEALDLLDFSYKIAVKAGLAEDGTYLPRSLHPDFNLHSPPTPKTAIPAAREEAQMVLCGAIELLLKKQGLAPDDIDILVTTCSIFCPTPSLASLVVNHFQMRPDIQSYHLGGMGCSNGVVAVNLVKDMLKARPNSNALLVTTEITSPAFYRGRDKHRQVTNMIFRMGASAILFSNKPHMVRRAKYRLLYNHRVHLASRDPAYRCIWHGPDAEGITGTYLGKDVVTEATRGLSMALWKLGPQVLTMRQIAAYVVTELRRRLVPGGKRSIPAYKPKFEECLDHFLIHAGGAKVLDGVGKELQLGSSSLEPSRMVLHDYGNVSSSSTWYAMGYLESVRGVRKGQKLLQIGVGSGIKCGVNVWQAVRDVWEVEDAWAQRAPEGNPLGKRKGIGMGLLVLLVVLVLGMIIGLETGAFTWIV